MNANPSKVTIKSESKHKDKKAKYSKRPQPINDEEVKVVVEDQSTAIIKHDNSFEVQQVNANAYQDWLYKHNILLTTNLEASNEYIDKCNRLIFEHMKSVTEEVYDSIFTVSAAVIVDQVEDEDLPKQSESSETKAKKKGLFSWMKHKENKQNKQQQDQMQQQMEEQRRKHQEAIEQMQREHAIEQARLKEQMKTQEEQHNLVITQLQQQQQATKDLQDKLDTMLPKMTFQAQTLGVIGESELYNMFKSLNHFDLTIINQAKVNHVSDLWMIDNENKILYVVESKNKDTITNADIEKFDYDLKYIQESNHHETIKSAMLKRQQVDLMSSTKNNNANEMINTINNLFDNFTQYKVVGLFISLRTQTVNSSFGSCTYTFEKTYIGNQCISKEFFSMYLQTTSTINNTHKFNKDDYQRVVDLISDKYNSLKNVLKAIGSIQQNAISIQSTATMIEQELSTKMDDINASLATIATTESEIVKAEKKICDYIISLPTNKLRVQQVKDLSRGLKVFNGAKLDKQFISKKKAELEAKARAAKRKEEQIIFPAVIKPLELVQLEGIANVDHNESGSSDSIFLSCSTGSI